MIETEKSSTNFEEIEEFSPKKYIHRENQIRNLVRFASLLVLGLLIVEIGPIYYPSEPNNILPLVLITFLLIAFLGGIFLGFAQLRWINENRNKSTNLGGFIGLFGLILTLVVSLLSLIPADFLSNYNISVLKSIFLPLLGLGLVLIAIGAFTEMTRIDEPLLFWLSVYKFLIARLFLFIIAFSIMALGFIGWDNAIGLPLSLFLGGYVFGVVVWLNHTHFRKISTALSTLILLWGLYLLYPYIISGVLWPIPLPLLISGVLIVIGLGENGIIWRQEIFNFLVAVKNAVVQVVRTTIQLIRKTVLSMYLTIKAFLKYTWDHRVGILRAFLTIIGAFIVAFGFAVSLNTLFLNLSGVGWGLIIGGPLLYVAWFHQTNHAIYNFLVVVKNTIVQTSRSIYFTILAFLHYTWDHRVDIIRALLTIIGSLLIISAFFLSALVTPQYQIDLSISIGVVILGFLFLYAAWFYQTNHFAKQSLITLKNASVRTYHRFVVFLKNTYHSVVQFLQTYYRDVITTFALGLMILGPLISWIFRLPPELPLIPFLIGYVVGVAIWYKHANFRAVTTTLSTTVFLCGFVLLLTVLGSNDVLAIWIPGGLVLVGVMVDGIVWRIELWHVFTHTVVSIVKGIKKVAHTIHKFLVDTKNAIAQAFRAFVRFLKETYKKTALFIRTYYKEIIRYSTTTVAFIFIGIGFFFWYTDFLIASVLFVGGYILTVAIWYGHPSFRSVGTILSIGVVLWGVIFFVSSIPLPLESIEIRISLALMFIGLTENGLLWRTEIKDFLVDIKNAIVQAARSTYLSIVAFLYYTWDHRINILRSILTIIGSLLIILTFSLPLFGYPFIDPFITIVVTFLGLLLLYVAWFHQTNHFIKQSLISLRDAFIRTIHAFYNVLVAIKNAIIQAVRSAYLSVVTFLHYTWDHRIDILRALATLAGPLVILRAVFPDLHLLVRIGLLVCGLGLLYTAWFVQVNHFIQQLFITIRNVFVQLAHSIYNFFVAAKAAIIKASYTVVKLLSKAFTQLGQLVVAMIDSIILILFVILSVSAIFYGIVLILSGIFDPSGEWTKIFLAENLPILGIFIELIAKFVQNFTLLNIQRILESEVETLLGAWAGQPNLILIILGIPFIAPGIILVMITFLMRDSIKLSNLKGRTERSDEQ
ncbi:MAG: hypothetical protein ACFFB5_08235 [Promethearchaeota archaeon]